VDDTSTTKDFGPIADDYAFYEKHASEAAADLRAYEPLVRACVRCFGERVAPRTPLRLLDFGCGEGRFSRRFLTMAAVPPEQLQLTLVDPVAAYRRLAAATLRPFALESAEVLHGLPPHPGARFDLVLANHVFYYVPDLDGTLARILRSLAPSGLFLAAMAGTENVLFRLAIDFFALLGVPVPFHLGEEFEAAVRAATHDRYETCDVHFRLAFPDSEENRLRLLRFLLGEWFARVPRPELLAALDPYGAGDEIDMHVTHRHFTVAAGGGVV